MTNTLTQNTRIPVVAVTTGDPAGIGPEIVYKALQSNKLNGVKIVVVGPMRNPDSPPSDVDMSWLLDSVNFRDDNWLNHDLGIHDIKIGQISATGGKIAYDNIATSVDLAISGKVDAIATAPINKESLKAADVPFIGHTEILASLSKTKNPLTMFETGDLRVFFLSRHLSMRDMLNQITKQNIIECAHLCFKALRQLGINDATMAIAGLNPHCGEHGLFGTEEQTEIAPAVEYLQSQGYDVAGPIGADSVFHQAAGGKFNSVLSLYHDQGHIATKTLDFYKTISVTCGMPFVRTSVDHGTAFDIAGKGIASEESMIEAILLAAKYAQIHA